MTFTSRLEKCLFSSECECCILCITVPSIIQQMQFGETGPEFWKVPSPTLSQRKGYSDCFITFTPQIFDINGENISFDAGLVMYINSTNIPPIMIINRIYENQNLLYIVPLMRHTIVVCIRSISPIAMGCFICVNISLVTVLVAISSFIMSEGILFKILVLRINEMAVCLSSEVLKDCSLFLIYKTNIFIKLLKLALFNANMIVFFCYLFLWYLGFLF